MKLISGLAAVVLAGTTLAQPATAATAAPASEAARASAGWLATQLTDGVIHNPNYGGFDDYGLTVDIGISMDEVGGEEALVRQIRQAMASRVDSYVTDVDYGSPEHRYSGSLAKSLVFAQVSGADPRSYGGFDLVQEVEERVTTAGPSRGRLTDEVGGADYANTFGQALAARGLAVAGSPLATDVTDFLLQQQCTSGYFRIFFDSDPSAPEQGCSEGADGTDTDATAMVVAQLSAVPSRSAAVDAAVERAVAWLVAQQREDGSFSGSAVTPDPNTNSTGLAASALAAGGRCLQAGRAAEWVAALQVGRETGNSPLAGEEGALPYTADALTTATSDGITDAVRDQWWRATVQAVAGLTHVRGSVAGVQVTSTGTDAGTSAVLSTTGAQTGDRFCLSGPGIDGTRSVVVAADGTLTGRVTLPATAGAASYVLTGRDGSVTHVIDVRSTVPGAAPAAPDAGRASVAGVRLVGPAGFRKARSKAVLEVRGAAPDARFTLRGPGLADITVTAGSDGQLTRTVTLPKATTIARYVLVGSDGQVEDATTVLGRKRLKVSTLRADGPRERVLVRRLAPREKVRLLIRGDVVAKGRANGKGRFIARVAVPDGRLKVRVRAVGQFAGLRSGSMTVEAR